MIPDSNKSNLHCFRTREPQCTCSHPEALVAGGGGAGGGAGAGAGGGKQRQGGAEPHRMRGKIDHPPDSRDKVLFEGVKKQQSFESYLDTDGIKKQDHKYPVGSQSQYQGWK